MDRARALRHLAGRTLRWLFGSSRGRVVLLLAGTAAIANLPTTTNVLVNYVPQPVTQPLYAKAIAFVDRDIQMRQVAGRIVGAARNPEEKADLLLRWTAAYVRPTPPGMPAIDDHPYNTVVRGYGDPDQAADVFANLAAYAGISGGVVMSRGSDGSMLYAFAVLDIGRASRLFDVREGRAFRDRSGALASVDDLRTNPSLFDGIPSPAGARGLSYPILIEHLERGPHRRPADQMPLPRLLAEIKRLLRLP